MAQKLNDNGVSARKTPVDGIANGASDPLLLQSRIPFQPARKTVGVSTSKDLSAEPLNSKAGCPTSGRAPERKDLPELPLDPDLTKGIVFRRIGAGLANLGNTCFLNSVLQCLTYTEPLAAYLQSGRHKTACRASGFCAMCAIQNHVTNALGSSGKILAPSHLVKNLRSISRSFRISRQEDAHEYMVNLMESMHKCCLPSGIASESPSAYEKSLVHNIFGGRLRSQVKCTLCLHGSNTFDPFLDLSLQIVQADSLLKALSHFTAVEQLDGGERRYQCERCKVKVQALKQLTVDKAPYVLAIHLKRFRPGGFGGKIDKKVEFEPTLDMKPFVSGPHEWDLKYTLYGVLVHAGWSTRSGHYYCFIRTSSGIWHALDDNRVYQVSEKTVLEQKAYMLFYVRDKRTVYQPIIKPQSATSVLRDSKSKPVNMVSEKESQSYASSASVVSHSSPRYNSNKEAAIKGKDQIPRKQENLSNGISTFEHGGPSYNAKLPSSVGSVESLSKISVTWETDAARDGGICKPYTSSNGHQVVASMGNGVVIDHTADNGQKTAKDLVNVGAGNGPRTDINLGDGAADNGHKTAKHLGNDDISNHHGANFLVNGDICNDANGNGHRAAKPLRNGHLANHSSGVKHEAVKCSSSGNGLITAQKDENGSPSPSKEDEGVKGVSLKKMEPDSFSNVKEEASCAPMSNTQRQSLKKMEPDSLSNVKEEASCAPMSNTQRQDTNNCRSHKKVKLQKHFQYPRFLQTMPLARRHLFLTAIIISKKRGSYKRKKHIHLKPKSLSQSKSLNVLNCEKGLLIEQHDVSKRHKTRGSLDQKAFTVDKGCASNVTNSLNILNSEKGLPIEQHDVLKKRKTTGSADQKAFADDKESGSNVTNYSLNGKHCFHSFCYDKNNELSSPVQNESCQTSFKSRLHVGSVQSSSGQFCIKNGTRRWTGAVKENIQELCLGNGAVRSDELGSKCNGNNPVLYSVKNEKELSVSACILQNGDASARCGMPERGTFASHYLNSDSLILQEAWKQDMTRFSQNCMASLMETELEGITVPQWNGIEGHENNSVPDHKKASVGYVLDGRDEEYDCGRRKKVKTSQSENGTMNGNKGHSNGCDNPFQAMESSKVRSHSSRKKRAIVRNQPARILANN